MARAGSWRAARAVARASALIVALGAPAAASAADVPATDANIRYEGHWDLDGGRATTVNSGSRIALSFTGRRLVGRFDVSSITNPPQVYVSVDGAPPRLVWIDRPAITLAKDLAAGTHRVDLAVKDVDERANRWVPPLRSGLILTGYELDDGGRLRPVARRRGPRIEFLGDSITQGVRVVGPQIGPRGSDATKDYAWLVGQAFDADFHQVGFGAQGILRPGGGSVPPAPAAFGLNFAGSRATEAPDPQAVVVNQGTNDALNGVPAAQFQPAYASYLRQVRTAWPNAVIFAMRPFGGYFATEIAAAVESLRDRRVVYVDTTGWLEPKHFMDGLHPTFAGHAVVADRLQRVIAARTGWRHDTIRPGAVGLLTGFEGPTPPWEPGDHVLSTAVTAATPPNGTTAYDGSRSLAVTSTVAPLTDWREVTAEFDRPVRLPDHARNLFAFVSVAAGSASVFDVRLTLHTTHGARDVVSDTIPNLAGFLPWARVHLNLDGRGLKAPITGISIAVRGEGESSPGSLSFQVDDIGWTSLVDG